MSSYLTYRDSQILELQTPYSDFKGFKKSFNEIINDGYSSVFQQLAPESTVVVKMRYEFDEQIGYNILSNDAIGILTFVIQEVVQQLTGTSASSDLTCFVMTHPQIEQDELFIEEVYFQFPYIKTSVESMKTNLHKNLIHFFSETDLYQKNLDIEPVNDIDDIVMDDIYSIGVWPLPGSYIMGSLLTITHVFDRITKEQTMNGEITGFPPEAYLSTFEIPDGQEYDYSNSFFFTNINGFPMNKKKKTQREKNRDVTQRLIEERQREIKRTKGELCRLFLQMMDPERFMKEVARSNIGQVLFNVLKGSEEGLEIWKDIIDQKIKAYNNRSNVDLMSLDVNQPIVEDEEIERLTEEELFKMITEIHEECNDVWDFLEYTESTIGTLRYWAKIDNPDRYKSFVKKDVNTLAWKCLNTTSSHTDVAKLVYAKYSEQCACANIKDGLWFGFWNHRWHELDTGHYLRIKLSEEIPPIFEDILNECNSEFKKAISDEDKEKWARLMQACVKMIKDLKTVSYKNNIMKECAEKFYDPDFVQKLDENRVLLGMPNGVYDVETDTFRPGKPEDFITLSTKAKYNDNYTWDHPRVKQVIYYMKTVYPDRDLRRYVLKSFGTIAEGGNMNKDFYNMVGEGDNSKSMVAKLMKLALGKYIGKIPVSMIMGRRGQAGNATPHLADKKGVRALFVEEPPRGQSNVSVVKEMSGNDDILSRALFKMPIVFSPQWKLFVWTNHLLEAPAEEKAYWNRQKVVDHESTFTFDAPETIEEQFATKMFPRDPFFDRQLVIMAEPFLWCLIQWYKLFKKEGLVPPKRVIQATESAKLRNDIYLQYIGSSITQGTQHDKITVDALYDDFKSWHTNSFVGRAPPNKYDFEDHMSKPGHLGSRPIGSRWSGIKFLEASVQLPSTGMMANMNQQYNPQPQQRLIRGN